MSGTGLILSPSGDGAGLATLEKVAVRGIAVLAVAAVFAAAGSGADKRAAAQVALRGTIAYDSFYSKALRGKNDYAVYLPPGYATSKTRYPVVYYLHGLPASTMTYRAIAPIAQAVGVSRHPAIVIGVQGARQTETATASGATGVPAGTGRRRRPSSSSP